MYTEDYFNIIKKQTLLRVALFIALVCFFVAAMFTFNALRLMVPTCASAAIGFVFSYFIWSFKISPYVKYNRYLKEVRVGQKRTTRCEFRYFTPETRIRDGVEVHDMVVAVGKEEEDERLFYWDQDMKKPEYTEGDRIEVLSYGNFVVDCKKVTGNQG